MNKTRRNDLKVVIEMARKWMMKGYAVKSELENICSDEEYYFDNMPDNLQGSTRGIDSENAVDAMNDAISSIDDAIESINEAMEYIEGIV
jgi:hypothetical protein